MKRILLFTILNVMLLGMQASAQNVFNPNDPIVNYDPTKPLVTPPDNVMAKWVRTPKMWWNTERFKCYYFNGMAFRLRYPNGYDPSNPNKKYPLILFFHGGGEIGPVQDNEFHLLLGASKFENIINTGQFDAFMLFPQQTYIAWEWQQFENVNKIVDSLDKYCHVDQDRVITMGLSIGGYGSVNYGLLYPKRTATIVASAPVNIQRFSASTEFIHVPMWMATGGTDVNPDTISARQFYAGFKTTKGGDLRYSYFPTLGHLVWNEQWDEPGLAWYWQNAFKANPLVFFNRTHFPTGTPIDAKIGITPGFYAYEWRKDGALIATSTNGANSIVNSSPIISFTGNEVTVRSYGSYTVRFKRTATSNWSEWSTKPAVITSAVTPPVANPGNNVTTNLPYNFLLLNGSASTASPGATLTSYTWTKVFGPSQYILSTPNTDKTWVNDMVQGVYVFRLKVTDSNGGVDSADVTITVNGPPSPFANAGNNKTLTLPTNTTVLDGSASTPSFGSTISKYSWTKVSGPSQFNIVTPSGATTTVNNLVQGVYTFNLTVTDANTATNSATVQVTVNGTGSNQPPVANPGSPQTISLPTNTVNLTGSASSDPDGSIASYSWTKTSGPAQFSIVSPGSANTAVNNLVQGTYTFQLTVTDNLGATGSGTVTITVNSATNTPPVADAGSPQTITLPTNSVNLTGSASNDPDGSISTYSWTKTAGPAQFNIVSPGAANTVVNNLVQGSYTFQLTVTDNKGASTSASVVVTVNPLANVPPVANAGSGSTITLPTNSASLNGSGSNDPDGSITGYSWTKTAGPSQFSIATPTLANTTVNNLVQGTYTFQLTVTDNKGASSSATVSVVVKPAPGTFPSPVANAGADVVTTLPYNFLVLDGSGSQPAPGSSLTGYNWTQVSGPSQATIASPDADKTWIFDLTEGVFVFALKVTDANGETNTENVTITVNGLPKPTANAGPNKTIVLPTNSVNLDGSASTPSFASTITKYSWTKVSGPAQGTIVTPNAATTAVNNLSQGVYVFMLTVTDQNTATNSANVTITVNGPLDNVLPIANAGTNTSITLPTNSVSLNGTGSSDPDGTISTYSWTKTAGPAQYNIVTPAGSTTTVNNLVEGSYTFQLTVTDNKGGSSSATVSVTVNPAPNKPPVANAGSNISISLPTNSVSLSGTGSSDPDGTITGYNWTKIAGPSQYNIVTPGGSTTTVNNLVQGSYTFQLTVTDNKGATASATVVVFVAAAPGTFSPPVANAGPNVVTALPYNFLVLDGSASAAAPGSTIVSYSWSRISGPTSNTILSPTSDKTWVFDLAEGVYVFSLKVTDNNGEVDTANVTITVNGLPKPTANAGSNQTITLPVNSVTVNGSASTPAFASSISGYLWTKVSGPAQYTIVTPNAVSTTINNLVQGVYTFQLTVTDQNTATNTATVVITVNAAVVTDPPNQAPIANAGTNTSITLPTNSVSLTGSGSNDNDGTITNYSWAKTAGPTQHTIVNPASANTTVNNLVQGSYTFTLTVTDNKGAKSSANVVITVLAANVLPVASAGSNISLTLPTNSVTLTGTGTDADGSISTFNWSKTSGPTSGTILTPSAATTIVNNLVAGTYTFRFTVTDNRGGTANSSITVLVNPSTTPGLIARAGRDQTITLPNSALLDGTASTAGSGKTISASRWTKISGPSSFNFVSANSPTTWVNTLAVGVYTFRLTVTDNTGFINWDDIQVTVTQTPAPTTVGGQVLVTQPAAEEKLTVFPNPATNSFNLRWNSNYKGVAYINLFDASGKKVKTLNITKLGETYTDRIYINTLKRGIFYVEIKLSDGKSIKYKALKN